MQHFSLELQQNQSIGCFGVIFDMIELLSWNFLLELEQNQTLE